MDAIAEISELSDHSGRPALLGPPGNGWASFFVTDSLVQDLPDQAAKPMGNHSDRLIMPQPRHIAAIEDFEDASFLLDRGVGGLIENAAHGAVTLRRPVAVVDFCTLIVARAGAHPGRELGGGRKGGGGGAPS